MPEGLRVAWRDTDMSAFRHAPWATRQWRTARLAASAAVADGVLLAGLAGGWAADAAAVLARRARHAGRSARRATRLPFARRPAHPWIVIVNLSLGRDLRLEDAATLMKSVPSGATIVR